MDAKSGGSHPEYYINNRQRCRTWGKGGIFAISY